MFKALMDKKVDAVVSAARRHARRMHEVYRLALSSEAGPFARGLGRSLDLRREIWNGDGASIIRRRVRGLTL